MSKKRPPGGRVSPRALAEARPRSSPLTWRQKLLRLGAGVAGGMLLLLLLEGALRLAGYGHETTFFVKAASPDTLATNRRFGWRFMPRESATEPWPLLLPAGKAPGTTRIFVLGESAAQGTPAPAFGFGRILEVMLAWQHPERRFEVVNVAMRGINSHVIREIAEECARLEPDLFLIYMGNNETVGLHAPEPGRFNLTPCRRILRASQWARSTRVAQLTENTARSLRKKPAKREQDMELFRRSRLLADAPERRAVYDNFRANLEDILRATRASGAKVLLSTVAVNLQDFPPLASLHRPSLAPADLTRWEAAYASGTNAEARGVFSEAITHYQEALRLDDHYADLHFRLGRSHQALRQTEAAREHFLRAREWDALQFRTDGRLNRIIRETAAGWKDRGVVLVDTEKVFEDEAARGGGLPGNRFFYEHVHPTFDGDYLLASTFVGPIAEVLGLNKNGLARARPTRQECAVALGFSEWDEVGVNAAMVRATARAPYLDQIEHEERQRRAEEVIRQRTEPFYRSNVVERSVQAYQAALARRPNDWQIRFNFGNLLKDFNRERESAEQYAAAVRLMPGFLPLRVTLAQVLWNTGMKVAAVEQLRECLRIDPDYAPAREALVAAGIRP